MKAKEATRRAAREKDCLREADDGAGVRGLGVRAVGWETEGGEHEEKNLLLIRHHLY